MWQLCVALWSVGAGLITHTEKTTADRIERGGWAACLPHFKTPESVTFSEKIELKIKGGL